MMDVLNECPYGTAAGADPCPWVGALSPIAIVAGQRLPQHRHERPIAREVDRMRRVIARAVACGHVQAHKRFSSSGHAGHEDDRLSLPRSRLGDDSLHCSACDCKVHRPGVAAGDVVDGVAGVE